MCCVMCNTYSILHFIFEFFRLPSWAAKSMESLEYIAKIASSTHAATPSLARLKFGYLLKEMLENFSQKINSTLEPNQSVWLYSGHDLTILNVLNGLRIHDVCFNIASVTATAIWDNHKLIQCYFLAPFAGVFILFDVWTSQERQQWILCAAVL